MAEYRRSSMFPKQVGGLIEPLTRPLLKSKGLAGSRILTEWKQIVGEALAEHSMPEKLSFPPGKKTGGTLVISVESGFAIQLQYMQPVLLEKLATYFGYKAVDRITIAHTYVPATPQKKPEPPKATLPNTSVLITDDVVDDELREALRSLAQTLSGQQG